tara:strand:+ start:307 stop:1488 length:1182 start_codon:yes stop_codon:yes gene_type:complete
MNDSRQITNKIDWLDSQRRDDRKMVISLREHINALQKENKQLTDRMMVMELEIARTKELASVANKVDEIIEKSRSDFITQINNLEAVRINAEVEMDRLRIIDRDKFNKSLSNLHDEVNLFHKTRDELFDQKDREEQLNKEIRDLKIVVEKALRVTDDNESTIFAVEERSLQDSKRIADFKSEIDNLRRLLDNIHLKLESVQDSSVRNHNDVSDLISAETDRKLEQTSWIEQQEIIFSEREHWWQELQDNSREIQRLIDESSQRMHEFGETHRSMQSSMDKLDTNFSGMEDRINDFVEIQRHSLERYKNDWKDFVVDNEKKWSDHALYDESWKKDNERVLNKFSERSKIMEDTMFEMKEMIDQMKNQDQQRLKELFSILRKFLSVYDIPLKKVP